METERSQLRRTILLDPANDFHRLVFADWLEEHGREDGDPEWAELIRVQVERERLKTAIPAFGSNHVESWINRIRDMQSRAEKLLPKVLKAWRKDLGEIRLFPTRRSLNYPMGHNAKNIRPYTRIDAYVSRGFIDSVGMHQQQLLKKGRGNRLFASHPIQWLRLRPQECTAVDSANRRFHGWQRGEQWVGSWPRMLVAAPIWDLIAGEHEDMEYAGFRFKFFADPVQSLVQLDLAAANYGRSVAGLPSLSESRQAVRLVQSGDERYVGDASFGDLETA